MCLKVCTCHEIKYERINVKIYSKSGFIGTALILGQLGQTSDCPKIKYVQKTILHTV